MLSDGLKIDWRNTLSVSPPSFKDYIYNVPYFQEPKWWFILLWIFFFWTVLLWWCDLVCATLFLLWSGLQNFSDISIVHVDLKLSCVWWVLRLSMFLVCAGLCWPLFELWTDFSCVKFVWCCLPLAVFWVLILLVGCQEMSSIVPGTSVAPCGYSLHARLVLVVLLFRKNIYIKMFFMMIVFLL